MPKKTWDGTLKISQNFDRQKNAYRITNPKKPGWKPPRFKTGVSAVDSILGGLPYGVSLFVGGAGSGKSLLARTIAREVAKTGTTVLYFCFEDITDSPHTANVVTLDYTEYLPNPRGVVEHIFGWGRTYKPGLIVLDSITTAFSKTNKAVEEADIRPNLLTVAQNMRSLCPVIATSEIRGSGWFTYTAGGQGVAHRAHLWANFTRLDIFRNEQSVTYGLPVGNRLYTLDVVKDREGVAQQGVEFAVVYNDDPNPVPTFIPITSLTDTA